MHRATRTRCHASDSGRATRSVGAECSWSGSAAHCASRRHAVAMRARCERLDVVRTRSPLGRAAGALHSSRGRTRCIGTTSARASRRATGPEVESRRLRNRVKAALSSTLGWLLLWTTRRSADVSARHACIAKRMRASVSTRSMRPTVVQTESELGAVPDARVRRGSSSVAGGCSTAARRFGWSAFRGGDEAVEFGGVDGGVVDAHRGEGRVRSRRRLPLRLTLQPLGWQGSAGYDGRAPRRPCRVLRPPLATIRRHQERPARGRASGLARASPGA